MLGIAARVPDDPTMADPATEPTNAADWWEDRYASGATRWSGKPNDLLVPEIQALAAGRALDLGCGTGGDAIWLAAHGWQVTAVDIAQAALTQGAAHAADAGVGERISWERHDFERSFPSGQFDLVSACYLQSPLAFQRLAALRAAAGAVAPGGTLVIVSHESTPSGGPHPATYMPTPDQLLADLALPDGDWTTDTARSVERRRTTDDGRELHYRDNVVRIRRH